MKYIIIVGDGMGDYPIEELGHKTPLEVAKTPNLDKLASMGKCGKLVTIPEGADPESALANMSILGYDISNFQGRGVLEAAAMGINVDERDIAFRCNTICVENDTIKNHSGGHISSEESHELIEAVAKELGNEEIRFFPGVSYRHILILKHKYSPDLICTPPHDVPGTPFKDVLVKAKDISGEKTAELLNTLIIQSRSVLENHPVNIRRVNAGKNAANMIWPWAPGRKPVMKTFQEKFGIKGAVISAVDLIRGLGIYAGFNVIDVDGATGLYDTNYEGKAEECLKALETYDLVYVHIEAPDEASHQGDLNLKIKCIEDFDKRVVGRILKKLKDNIKLTVLTDHYNPISVRTHTCEPVPFLIYDKNEEPDDIKTFTEDSCSRGSFGQLTGEEFIKVFLNDQIK
ncbi:cofactor-independent phosphoglycerate mutase [Candidatus Borrarchaeum sp.]|uniref:cofactor-independent phosphoglycerate mutase n=1 Tax=Candidatus Borrarchaeum sp. TaxID=2846742 RepID=UPI00257F53ED|nr:cofactor-independent phosphoglycerate mutase [Candidatus Borrarchaeum sp.]